MCVSSSPERNPVPCTWLSPSSPGTHQSLPVYDCSVMSNCATPQTVARQAPLSMGFSRQEHWGGLPCPPPPGRLVGIKLTSPVHWQADSLPPEPPGTSLCSAILPLNSWALSNQEQWEVGSDFWKDWLGDPKTDWKCHCCPPHVSNECHSRYLLWIVGRRYFFFLIKKKH